MTNPYHPNPFQHLRSALQYLLDCEGDGWQLQHYVIVVGLEQMDSVGTLRHTAWVISQPEQPEYVSDGLLSCAEDMRASAEAIGDDD